MQKDNKNNILPSQHADGFGFNCGFWGIPEISASTSIQWEAKHISFLMYWKMARKNIQQQHLSP